jgi:hypothetical protein
MVNWQVSGVNAVSGTPTPPQKGRYSEFYVRNPPVNIIPKGRGAPMSYTVIPRIDYPDVYADDMLITYYSQDQRNITQDEIDQCRQEYVDMNKTTRPDRTIFVDFNTYTGLGTINFPFLEINDGQYSWAIFTIAHKLQDVMNDFGLKMTVSSGYRNPVDNDTIKPTGKPNSRHIYGDAADIDISSDAEWLKLCNSAVKEGACIEPHSMAPGWVHMDWRDLANCGDVWPHKPDVPCGL